MSTALLHSHTLLRITPQPREHFLEVNNNVTVPAATAVEASVSTLMRAGGSHTSVVADARLTPLLLLLLLLQLTVRPMSVRVQGMWMDSPRGVSA